MDTQPDREDLAKLDAHINRLGIAADFRSNLISIASRLHYERTRETCMPAIDQLDAEHRLRLRVLSWQLRRSIRRARCVGDAWQCSFHDAPCGGAS